MVGSCEHGNGPSDFIRYGEFLIEKILVSQEELCYMELVS